MSAKLLLIPQRQRRCTGQSDPAGHDQVILRSEPLVLTALLLCRPPDAGHTVHRRDYTGRDLRMSADDLSMLSICHLGTGFHVRLQPAFLVLCGQHCRYLKCDRLCASRRQPISCRHNQLIRSMLKARHCIYRRKKGHTAGLFHKRRAVCSVLQSPSFVLMLFLYCLLQRTQYRALQRPL